MKTLTKRAVQYQLFKPSYVLGRYNFDGSVSFWHGSPAPAFKRVPLGEAIRYPSRHKAHMQLRKLGGGFIKEVL